MEEEGLPNIRVTQRHTGAEFESGAVYRARGLNEPQPGVVPEAAGVDEGWSGGHANYSHESGRRRKLASTPDTKTILVPGRGSVKVFKGSSAVEDERWIYITEIKHNGTKVYMCLACRSAACPYFRTLAPFPVGFSRTASCAR